MASKLKILFKCLFILKKCILLLYSVFFWFFGSLITLAHLGALIGIENWAKKHGHQSCLTTDLDSMCNFMILTFVAMTFAVIGLCYNWIIAPVAVGFHTVCCAIGLARSFPLSANSVHELQELWLIFLFFEVLATWYAYDLYKLMDKRCGPRRIENTQKEIHRSNKKKCFFILKKWILAFYSLYHLSYGYVITHNYFERHKWTELWNIQPGSDPNVIYESNFMMATFVTMICVLIGLCYNFIFAPILLALHAIVCCFDCIATNKQNWDSKILKTGLSIFVFFGSVAIWFAYDLYKLKVIKRSSKRDETNPQNANDSQRRDSFRNLTHTKMEEGNEAPVEEDDEVNQTNSNEKVTEQNFTRDCV